MSRTAAIGLGHERAHEVEDARLDRRVEAGRGLVEHEQLRVGRERDGDDDALLHAARELVRIALEDALRVGDLDPPHRGQGTLPRLVRALAEHRERLDDLGADLRRRVQRGARVLVDHRRVPHPEAPELLVVHLASRRRRPRGSGHR